MPKVCEKCNEKKAVRYFQQIGRKPPVYEAVCLKCKHEDSETKLAAQMRERRIKKKVAAKEKQLVKEQAKKNINDKRARRKESKHREELANRTLERRKLIHFIKRFHKNYLAGWVHHDICRRLEKFAHDVEQGKDPRLMLFMPPRHGKSEIASNYFPSWVLGHYPHFEIIAASYAVSLPMGFSRKVRARVQEQRYKTLFPKTFLSRDSRSAEAWLTTGGGGYVAAGVGGGITGKGAHILIIDDPVKDAAEADSETQRESVWDWYGSTAYTRLAPGGGVLVIQTRWHDDDLSGRLLNQMKEKIAADEEEFDKWELIEYPAVATREEWINPDGTITDEAQHDKALHVRGKGEALHPDRFPIRRLRNIKATLQPRHWSALYQQNPVPEEGVYFTKDMFRTVSATPNIHGLNVYAAFDLAIAENQQNDYTVGVVGGLDHKDQLYILDVIRFRGDSFKIVEAILNVQQKYTPVMIGIEKGQLEHAIKPQLKKRIKERRLFPTLAEGKKALVPVTDKLKRARPLQGRMQQGMVYFNHSQPWYEELNHEFLRFPGGVHDDMVDAAAWLARMVLNESPPRPPKEEKHKSWKDNIAGYVNGGRVSDPMAA